jgi:hypothetical protein
MGFRQREKRRKAAAAKDRAQTLARNGGSAAPKWWLTIVKLDTCCADCAAMLRAGREMVYRHEPREALCHRCLLGNASNESARSARRSRRCSTGQPDRKERPACVGK